MTEQANEVFRQLGSVWEAISDETLSSCCGDTVEWDCEACPSCGQPNPLVEEGWI